MSKPKSQTPLTSVKNSWVNSSVCKHFFPCNGLQGGGLVDVKGGLQVIPAGGSWPTGENYLYNQTEKSVLSTTSGGAIPIVLTSGEWAVLPANKAALFMCAGYIDNSYTVDYMIRCSIGDINDDLGGASTQGWGLADGTVNAFQHVAMAGNYHDGGGATTGCQNTAVGAQSTGSALGQNTYFIRYAIYQPGAQIESKILNLSGTVVIDSSALYGVSGANFDQQGATFVNAFRMSGFRCTGIALYYFNTSTVPSDYMTAVNYNGSLWKTGVKEVYAKTGW